MKARANYRSHSDSSETLDCGIVVREFEFQSRYYGHLWTNTIGNGIVPYSQLTLCAKWTYNVHNDRTQESRNSKTRNDFLFRYETIFY